MRMHVVGRGAGLHVPWRVLCAALGLGAALLAGQAAASAQTTAPGATPGNAASLDAIAAHFDAGAYEAAALLGAARGDADGAAAASRAWSAQAILSTDEDQARAYAEAARTSAERALALEPEHVQARLQLAIALWLEGRTLSRLEGHRRGLAAKGRTLIEAVRADAPDDPWAHALLGGWHLEVARRGGAMGRALYGASVREGAEHYYTAMALAPDDAAIATQCGLAFLALDPRAYREHGRVALERALAADADDAFERAMQERAAAVLAMLDADEHPADVRSTIVAWVE